MTLGPLPSAGAGVWALALSLLPLPRQTPAPSWRAEAGFRLDLPPGWTIAREIPGHGLELAPPGGSPWSVEIAVWTVSVGVASPDAAAREHERILAARMKYSHLREEPIRAAGAGDGVYTEGSAMLPGDREVRALFAVFLAGNRAYVIGTFADPPAADAARQQYLDPILGAFALTGPPPKGRPMSDSRPLPAPRPPPGPAPSPVVQPPRPGPATSGVLRLEAGATPPAPEPPPLELVEYSNPAGFSLKAPTDWKCDLRGHVIALSAPDGTSVSLLPIVASGTRLGTLTAEELARACLGEEVAPSRLLHTPCEGDSRAAWLRVSTEWAGQARTGVIGCTLAGPTSLAAAVFMPNGLGESSLHRVAPIIASFQAQFPAAPLPAQTTVPWTDPLRRLVIPAPEGWLLRGGVSTYDKQPCLSLQAASTADPRTWFTWLQPVRPIFHDLTPAMERLGFRAGDAYYSYEGADPRTILRRGSASEFLTKYLLPQGMVPFPPDDTALVEQSVRDMALLNSPNEKVVRLDLRTESGAGRQFGACFISQAVLGDPPAGGFWEAACLAFGGPEGLRSLAGRAWRSAVTSVRVAQEGSASPAEKADLTRLLNTANKAASAGLWDPLLGDVAFRPALAGRESAPATGATYSVPASATALWRDIASGQSVGCVAAVGGGR